MNKSVILLCKNHKKCNNNDKGDCKLSHVSFASEGGLKKDRLICEDFEPIPTDADKDES